VGVTFMGVNSRQQLGQWGEAQAADYLQANGYRIRERNWRFGRLGELDLIAVSAAGVLVGVEVKTTQAHTGISGLDQLTPVKVDRLQQLLLAYAQQCANPDQTPFCQTPFSQSLRLDAIIVSAYWQGGQQRAKIQHIENITG
jgi:putative endonuclease